MSKQTVSASPVLPTFSVLARYNYGGTAKHNAVPLVMVPHGAKSPNGEIVSDETALWPSTRELPSAKEAGKDKYFPVQRLAVGDTQFVAYVPGGSRTYEAAEKALGNLGFDALSAMTDEEFEKEAARIAAEEAQRALAALRAKRAAGFLTRK